MSDKPEIIIYWLDKTKRIEAVEGPWDEFALENDGADVISAKVEGKSILNFVTGDMTKMWFETLLQLAGIRNEPIERPYRCDSPQLKRYMQMNVIQENRNLIRLEHQLLRTEPRELPVNIAFRNEISLKSGRVKIHQRCSVCGRIHHENAWYEPDGLQDKQNEKEINMLVSYTVCPSCQLSLPHTI